MMPDVASGLHSNVAADALALLRRMATDFLSAMR
jgi:hypothetical protein